MKDRDPKRWTDSEWLTARRMKVADATAEQIAEALGRTIESVRSKFKNHGLPPPRLVSRPVDPAATEDDAPARRVDASALADRDARAAASRGRTLTQSIFGDPPPGFSALDRKRQEAGA
jgi:hypothetical protein